ncbi:hypothetical protein P171DRAFT_505774 [Karstenula rhodostoma CBS 690.94]|uniref:Uncharacterized protein n=1 Tax=Karstenula rhodostoma CBS 690.94 TaxID=1392251 RepID=A0A9P4P7K7_9PLEO|nr:hypothetical protein P171DRAFT_505774 [Karstenula rhodostoma CBS 690.94]
MSSPSDNPRATTICATAARFCHLFVTGASPADILSQCFTSNPKITEHGPQWASMRLPFLSRTFTGRRAEATQDDQSCDQYFDVLGVTLSFHPQSDAIPPENEFIVSTGEGRKEAVVVRAKSRISSVKTGIEWEETFVFMFGEFDGEGRIGHLEIWSDGLSAWAAVGGERNAQL